jgi:hypothetical protein
MRRTSSKFCRKLEKVNLVAPLESRLSYPMLLSMMFAAQADRPLVRGLEPLPSVGASTDMCALDRKLVAPGHAAMMAPHPCSMRGERAVLMHPSLALLKLRKRRPKHEPLHH